ncbi:hypothetical protein [uncultured Corynebacterium sp.]|uniref:hypothetical protein n=1 Tax=uncultured Corynebacterium sp. TaxID=159447 RepID=UPI0025E56028|nr:hypothetical protein [uncultured Corynebacterium sp.]
MYSLARLLSTGRRKALIAVAVPAIALSVGATQAVAAPAPTPQEQQSTTIVELTAEDIAAANDLAAERGEPALPENITSVQVDGEGNFTALDKNGDPVLMSRGFWGSAWKVTKCVAHLTLVILPGTAAFRAVKALGGITATARLLVGAGSWAEFRAVAGGAASEIIGISGIQENCF